MPSFSQIFLKRSYKMLIVNKGTGACQTTKHFQQPLKQPVLRGCWVYYPFSRFSPQIGRYLHLNRLPAKSHSCNLSDNCANESSIHQSKIGFHVVQPTINTTSYCELCGVVKTKNKHL